MTNPSGPLELSPVTLVFQDLVDAHKRLRENEESPKDVRRAFHDFVNHSQKLTSYMRREFKARTGDKWVAKNFSGWNAVTELFKALRSIDEHEEPIVLRINYTFHFHDLALKGDVKLNMAGTWEWDDPLADFPNDALIAKVPDPEKKGKLIDKAPTSVSLEYVLDTRQPQIVELLEKIGFSDILRLTQECLNTLELYYDFYDQKLRAVS